MVIKMLVCEGTSYKVDLNKIMIFSRLKDEEITSLNEIKYLKTRTEEIIPYMGSGNNVNFNVNTQKDVKFFEIKFTTTRSAHTPDEIKQVKEKFENDIKQKYVPFYNGLINAIG